MKKNLFLSATGLVVACFVLLLCGCLKDTGFKRYTMYLPVYKTTAEVRANIKSGPVEAVENPGKMYIIGNYILLNEKYKGVHVIDNTDPAKPINKSFIKIPGNEDIAVYGNTLYADCFTDLLTIDITDPMQATFKTHIVNIFPDRRVLNGFLIDSSKVVVDWITRDTTIEVDVPAQGFLKDNIYYSSTSVTNLSMQFASAAGNAGQGGSMARFAIQSNFLYTVTNSSLHTLNIGQPQQPTLQGSTNLGWGIETIYPFKDKLFIGSNTGMQIFSVANPATPVKLGAFAHARVCDPVIADERYAYVTLRGGTQCGGFTNQLDVVNVQNPTASTLVKSYPLTNPRGLSKDNNWLFICDGADGLKCFDASDVNNVTLKKTIPMAETFDVICINGLAIVSAKDGLYQYSYTDINNIRLLSKIGLK